MPLTRLAAAAVALALLASGCTGDDSDGDARKGDTESSAREIEKPTVDLAVKTADLVSPHQARGPLELRTRDAVVDVVERLLLATSAIPLSGGKAGRITDLFTADAARRAAGPDRAVVFDEDLPQFGALVPHEAAVELTGLAGSIDPATALVVATFRWNVSADARPANQVVREGELQLVPVAGDWKIAAYTLVVTRTIDDSTTTTTADSR